MERLHLLNVNEGDCTWIQHFSGRDTIVYICNGNAVDVKRNDGIALLEELAKATTMGGPQCKIKTLRLWELEQYGHKTYY